MEILTIRFKQDMMEQETHSRKIAGIKRLRLTNFRCYATAVLNLDASMPVVLYGPNGAGKTNILEAVSFLVPGKGLRNARLSDVARHALLPFDDDVVENNVVCLPSSWGVAASVSSALAGGDYDIGTGCEAMQSMSKSSLKTDISARRIVKINSSLAKSQNDLGDILSAVWITPAMDRIFNGESALRRRFLDRLTQSFAKSHSSELAAYANSYRQWGKLLREGCRDVCWLNALESSMAAHGVAIAAARVDTLSRMAGFLADGESGFPKARAFIDGYLENELLNSPALLVEENFKDRLQSERGLYADGGTISGPHNTDLRVLYENGMDAALCSTGQQKALLIAMVLAHIQAVSVSSSAYPLILFDEATAHLDKQKRDALFDILCSLPAQSWFTGTELSSFNHLDGKAQFFGVENALISVNVA